MVNITSNYYDMSNISSSTDIYTFMVAVNNLTGGYFMAGVLIVGFVIMLLATLHYGTREALMASSFITTFMSIFFLTLGFINMTIFLFIVISSGIMFVFTINKGPY